MSKKYWIVALGVAIGAMLGFVSTPTARTLLFDGDATYTIPVAITSPWTTAISAGGVASADAATITNPASSITASTRQLLSASKKAGTRLIFRLKRATANANSTPITYSVYGRYSSSFAWEQLRNRAGTTASTIAPDDTNDLTDGTYKYTLPDLQYDYWDRGSCNEFLVGVTTAYTGTTTTTAVFEVKVE